MSKKDTINKKIGLFNNKWYDRDKKQKGRQEIRYFNPGTQSTHFAVAFTEEKVFTSSFPRLPKNALLLLVLLQLIWDTDAAVKRDRGTTKQIVIPVYPQRIPEFSFVRLPSPSNEHYSKFFTPPISDWFQFYEKYIRKTGGITRLIQGSTPQAKKMYAIFEKQMQWIAEIVQKQIAEHFSNELIEQVLDEGFILRIGTKAEVIEALSLKGARKPFGLIGVTTMDELGRDFITLSFEAGATHAELSQVLINEAHHLIVHKQLKYILTVRNMWLEKGRNFGCPCVNEQGKYDAKSLQLFKSVINKGIERVRRIPYLLETQNSSLNEKDLQLKTDLLRYAHSYQPLLHLRSLEDDKDFPSIQKKFPSAVLVDEFQEHEIKIVKIKVIDPAKADSADKLMAVFHDFSLSEKHGRSEGYYYYGSLELNENFFIEMASNLDMQFNNNTLKRVLFKEYCQFMDDFHQRAAVARLAGNGGSSLKM